MGFEYLEYTDYSFSNTNSMSSDIVLGILEDWEFEFVNIRTNVALYKSTRLYLRYEKLLTTLSCFLFKVKFSTNSTKHIPIFCTM